MKKDKKYLEAKLGALQSLVPICEAPGFEVVESYARKQMNASVEEVYKESEVDPARHLASCSYYRGQGDTWMWISEMRTKVALGIADVRRQLNALRKEDADGHVER